MIRTAKVNSNSNGQIISINPTTEEELGRVETIDRNEIDNRLNKAKKAFQTWSKLPINERLKYLKKLSDVILDQAEEIATLIAQEQGKTIVEAKFAEIVSVLAIIRSLRRKTKKILQNVKVKHDLILFSHKKGKYRFEPFGVIAVISPWNYPFSAPMPEIVAALAAGNTVVFKPAPGTVLIGKKMNELFEQAGFPEGVVETIFINDKDASYLVGKKEVNKIVFTGSVKTGKNVMCRAAEHLSPVLLELGGKDAAIIAADADVERTAKGVVWGAFSNTGQACASIERAYVERQIGDQLISACIKEAKKITVGDPLDVNTDIGPLENKRQLEIVLNHVVDAKNKGAQIALGGKRIGERGFLFEPTIITGVNHSMKVMTEETFAPVLPIMVVDSIDEAIRLANDSQYGLSAYGWTSSSKTAEKLQRELEVGTVMINDATASWGEPSAPWGGFKKSGIGRTRAYFGLLEMVQVKYTCYDQGKKSGNLWWFPHDSTANEIADQAVKLLFVENWYGKIKPFFKLIKIRRFVTSIHWLSILKNLKKLF